MVIRDFRGSMISPCALVPGDRLVTDDVSVVRAFALCSDSFEFSVTDNPDIDIGKLTFCSAKQLGISPDPDALPINYFAYADEFSRTSINVRVDVGDMFILGVSFIPDDFKVAIEGAMDYVRYFQTKHNFGADTRVYRDDTGNYLCTDGGRTAFCVFHHNSTLDDYLSGSGEATVRGLHLPARNWSKEIRQFITDHHELRRSVDGITELPCGAWCLDANRTTRAVWSPRISVEKGVASLLTHRKYMLFGPPGVGKSTICGLLKAIDLEDVAHESRPAFVASRTGVFGAADLNPNNIDDCNRDEYVWITLWMPHDAYVERRRRRDATRLDKRNQANLSPDDFLVEGGLVVDVSCSVAEAAQRVLDVIQEAEEQTPWYQP